MLEKNQCDFANFARVASRWPQICCWRLHAFQPKNMSRWYKNIQNLDEKLILSTVKINLDRHTATQSENDNFIVDVELLSISEHT